MARPVLVVLAGVNGAGKSSIGGHQLAQAGLPWFNPDTFARELRAATGCTQEDANARAWAEGLRRLDDAIAARRDYAFETTLGGRTVPGRIHSASETHDVIIWFCGLASADLHVSRVEARVAAGGHDIPEARIRERYTTSLLNLIALMPALSELRVYDNSASVGPGEPIPDPILVLEMIDGEIVQPSQDNAAALAAVPTWARAVVEAAFTLSRNGP
jgi:predicted ABC-type ATPase